MNQARLYEGALRQEPAYWSNSTAVLRILLQVQGSWAARNYHNDSKGLNHFSNTGGPMFLV